MAESNPQIVSTANASQVKDTQRAQTNQQIGKLVEITTSTNADLVAALDDLVAAINAKPSA